MPSPFESAQLNLKLFELRRDPLLREARAWFVQDFNPESFDELAKLAGGEHRTSFAMVIGYWEMAASMVISGAIDLESFSAAHGELFAAYSKVHPFLSEIRAAVGENIFCKNLELLVMSMPDGEAFLARRRASLSAAAKSRTSNGGQTVN